MPFTVFVSEGVVSKESAQRVLKELSELVLNLHDLSKNPFMRSMLAAEIVEVPRGQSYLGGEETAIAVVEGKVPSFAFPSDEIRSAYVEGVTDILDRATGDRVDRAHIFTNTTYVVDGLWGIAGKAYSNAELLQNLEHAGVA